MTGVRRVASIGECMIELRQLAPGQLGVGYAGDTFNSAVYLARLGASAGIRVDYVTALGDDSHSDAIAALARAEGIGTGLIARLPGRLPGLYLIETDSRGERRFLYWRSAAAARDMLRGDRPAVLEAELAGFDLLVVSGITLSILDEAQRSALVGLLAACRARGSRIAFDGNYRPRGWTDPAQARAAFDAILALTDIALPTFEDEQAVFGDADPETTARRLAQAGVAEVVVKLGADGAIVTAGGRSERIGTIARQAIDTTGAGDSFNAGYLAARLAGREPGDAVRIGHAIAGEVVMHRGAIIPHDAMPALTF